MSIRDRLDRHAFEILLALVLVALAWVPPFGTAAVGLAALLLLGPLLVVLRAKGPFELSGSATIALASVVAVAAYAVAASLTAVNPLVSFIGKQGQHAGSMLWLGAASTFAAVLSRPRAGDAGRVARAVAVAGALLAASAVADVVGLLESFRFSPEPAGIMESSVSLGQVLVVASGAALAWALSAKARLQRLAALAVFTVIAGGLIASGARAAWVGLAVGAAAVGLTALAGRRFPAAGRVAAVATGAALAIGVLVAWQLFAPSALGRASEFAEATNDRSVIWASAFAGSDQDLWTGAGPEQFSAWLSWDSDPGVSLDITSTYDPHNLAVYWLHAGGIVGLGLAVGAAVLVLARMWGVATRQAYRLGIIALIGGVYAWGASVMFTWVNAVALLLVAMIAGVLLGARTGPSHADSGRPGATAVLTVAFVVLVAVVSIAIWWTPLMGELEWLQATKAGPASSAEEVRIAQRSGYPSAAAIAVQALSREANAEPERAERLLRQAEPLEEIIERDSVWHVDAALAGIEIETARVTLLERGGWQDMERYIAAGKRADPATGLWDYIGAVQAERLGEDGAMREHAREALAFPLPDPVRSWCEKRVAEESPGG